MATPSLYCQVIYGKGDNLYYTTGDQDSMSICELNAKLEKEGYKKKP